MGLITPLAWAKEALRWAVVGTAAAGQLRTDSFWQAMAGLLVVGLVYLSGAFMLYRYVVHRKMRQCGQLGVA
jgi:site-specific recombinase